MNAEMIEKLSAAIGKTTEETGEMLERNPKLKRLLSEMSEQDAQKLMAVLADKESIAKILSTPQAKSVIEAMGKK